MQGRSNSKGFNPVFWNETQGQKQISGQGDMMYSVYIYKYIYHHTIKFWKYVPGEGTEINTIGVVNIMLLSFIDNLKLLYLYFIIFVKTRTELKVNFEM